MCKKKMAVDAVQPKTPSSRHSNQKQGSSSNSPPTHHNHRAVTGSTTTTTFSSSATSRSSRHSLSSLRGSLPENPHLYDISELRKATNNFLSGNFTSSSSTRCWRCSLHGKDVIIFQRKSHNAHALRPEIIRQKISSICKSHHIAIVNLVGASISGEYVYLVYEFINGGSNLYDLLQNKKNPDFTVLNSWMSRMQIAADLANGVDYIHNYAGLDENFVHNHLKSSSVIVTEPSFNAKICHFGTAVLCGEPIEDGENHQFNSNHDYNKAEEISSASTSKKLPRSHSVKFTGTTGYMSPEFQITGVGTKKSDVYAFGVIVVELLSGEEPIKYKYNKKTKEYMKISVVDTARALVENGEGEREWRLRKWVDRRLNDSYPVDVADKIVRLALDCLHVDPDKRPDMRRVAGKISKLYLDSQAWCDKMIIPTEFTVSFAAR